MDEPQDRIRTRLGRPARSVSVEDGRWLLEVAQAAVACCPDRASGRAVDMPLWSRSPAAGAAQYRNRYWNFVKNARFVRCIVVIDGNR